MDEIKIEKVDIDDEDFDEFEEQWIYITEEPEIMGVDASRELDDDEEGYWTVYISVAEFIREDPLETILHTSITKALDSVEGVDSVEQEDREAWAVEGKVNATDLIRACVFQLKELYPQLRTAYDKLE